jgi:hypothetical protein
MTVIERETYAKFVGLENLMKKLFLGTAAFTVVAALFACGI